MIRKSESERVSWRESTWRESTARVFGCDLRSLAAFRIALGICIVWDLLFRSPTLVQMYSDNGFFTRAISYEYQHFLIGDGWQNWVWSLYWLSGSPAFQIALFVIAGIFALMLTAGYRTRLATIVTWVLLVSLHNRNPVILSSGDFLLKMMLFWSAFIPLGRVWSIDASRNRNRPMQPVSVSSVPEQRYVSVATAALIVQLFLMYFFSGVAKWNEIWWSGDAMHYVLHLDIFTTEFGKWMLEFPVLLKIVSLATILTEVFLIWLIFSPAHTDRFRMLNLFVFWGMHIGIGLAMSIGMFPVICMLAWLPLLPGRLWKTLAAWWQNLRWGSDPRTVPDSSVGLNADRHSGIAGTAPATNDWRSGLFVASQWFCAVMLAYVIVWNIVNVRELGLQNRLSSSLFKPGLLLNINQHFQMFGDPPRANPWFVYEATLVDGTQVDLFTGNAVTYERPESVRRSMPDFHWRRLHRNLVTERQYLREPLGAYFVRRWNETHDEAQKVARFRLVCYLEDTGPDYDVHNRSSQIWTSFRDEEKGAGSVFDSFSEEIKAGGGDGLGGLGF